MNQVQDKRLVLEAAQLSMDDDTVIISGKLTMREPAKEIGPFLKSVHDAACKKELKVLTVDVRNLTFINSSGIRVFINWTAWIRAENEARRYRVKFLSDPGVSWQSVSLKAMQSMAPDIFQIVATAR